MIESVFNLEISNQELKGLGTEAQMKRPSLSPWTLDLSTNHPQAPAESDLSFSILASGSSGNCTYIECGQDAYLVDAGLSGKKVEALMASIGRHPRDLKGILITHEHKDHIHGVGVLSRKYDLPIYANSQTWLALDKMLGNIAPHNRMIFEAETFRELGSLDVQSYEVSHDAVQPQFYAFQKGNKQFVMLTDTGYVSDRLRGLLKNADAYLIESNHEIEMLRYGPYPWRIKQRILSDKGHLCNEDGALAVCDLMGDKSKHIYLGHLSRENNTKEIAMKTMEQILERHDIAPGKDLHLHMTDPQIATDLRQI